MAANKSALLKPGMVTLACVLLWAAQHQPDSFTPASTGVWLLGALTVMLLVRAGLALATPTLKLTAGLLAKALDDMAERAQRDAREAKSGAAKPERANP
jgi:hypothetical protein